MNKIIIAIAIAATTMLTACGSSSSGPSIEQQAKAAVTASLIDPSSAQFSDKTIVKVRDSHVTYVCGLVNAKNRFGGYAGQKAYLVTFLDDSVRNVEMKDYVPSECQ